MTYNGELCMCGRLVPAIMSEGWKNEIKALCGSWAASHPGTRGGRGTGGQGMGGHGTGGGSWSDGIKANF